MKHQFYRQKKETWLDRFRRWMAPHFVWVVKNPEFTRKNPAKIKDIFLLK